MSNLFTLNRGNLVMNPQRSFPSVPLVKLGDRFNKVTAQCCFSSNVQCRVFSLGERFSFAFSKHSWLPRTRQSDCVGRCHLWQRRLITRMSFNVRRCREHNRHDSHFRERWSWSRIMVIELIYPMVPYWRTKSSRAIYAFWTIEFYQQSRFFFLSLWYCFCCFQYVILLRLNWIRRQFFFPVFFAPQYLLIFASS